MSATVDRARMDRSDDPLALAAWLLVRVHASGACRRGTEHSVECDQMCALLSYHDFPSLLRGIGIKTATDPKALSAVRSFHRSLNLAARDGATLRPDPGRTG